MSLGERMPWRSSSSDVLLMLTGLLLLPGLSPTAAVARNDAVGAGALRFHRPSLIGHVGGGHNDEHRAHAGDFRRINGTLYGDSGGNMARGGPALDGVFVSAAAAAGPWRRDESLFPLDGRQMFNWPGNVTMCIAPGMCSDTPLSGLLSADGLRNATRISSPEPGLIVKSQTMLETPLRVVGMPPWHFTKASFGGSMVVKTLSNGAVLMTLCVAWHGDVWPHLPKQPRMSILSTLATDGGSTFEYQSVLANASWFPPGDRERGSLTGATEHDIAELGGGRLIAVWRMGAGDGCGAELFNTSLCLQEGGYMPCAFQQLLTVIHVHRSRHWLRLSAVQSAALLAGTGKVTVQISAEHGALLR